jgi:hypothetical protein
MGNLLPSWMKYYTLFKVIIMTKSLLNILKEGLNGSLNIVYLNEFFKNSSYFSPYWV